MNHYSDSRAFPRAAEGPTRPLETEVWAGDRRRASPARMEVTRLRKDGGVLSKRISLGPDGRLRVDGSCCAMSEGRAFREPMTGAGDFKSLIEGLDVDEAITLGRLRDGIPDEARILPKARLHEANGAADVV